MHIYSNPREFIGCPLESFIHSLGCESCTDTAGTGNYEKALFVTNDGRVKILDFGIAKLTAEADGTDSQTEMATIRFDTDPGTVMGTMGYMSPEQLMGHPADHRADIFSFGAILYEMLAGKRAFGGKSIAETMSATLREDPPDLCEANKSVSPALERIVHHCLEKNLAERFQSARDLAFAIESLPGSVTSSGHPIPSQAIPTVVEGTGITGLWRLLRDARFSSIGMAVSVLVALIVALALCC